MKPELFVSLRYLLTKRKEKFISVITLISVLGIAIGVTALIVVIAVMSGFDRDLKDKIVGNYSHITVNAFGNMSTAVFNELSERIKTNPHVKGVSPYVQGQILLKESDKFIAVGIKGIEPGLEKQVTSIKQYIVQGSLDKLNEGGIAIGKELSYALGLKVGSDVTVYSPLGKQHTLKVAAIFYSGMYDYDLNLVFADLKTAQSILGLQDKISAVSVKVDELYSAGKIRDELSKALGPNFMLKTWMEANQNFFAALKLEKVTMFIILTLIILVASFNIISTLIVMAVEKTKDIGILKAIGMNAQGIRRIFTYQGIMIGFTGTFLGLLGGLGLCAILKRYQFIKLPQDIYYIDKLPVSLDWKDISLIILAAMVITIASTIYPAAKASKMNPVEALRYE